MNKNLKNRLLALAFAASVFVMPLGAQASAYNRAQLDEIAAPVALYPDSLLGSVLVASTYPDQVIDAYNWSVNYQALTQGQRESLVASMDWDDSVKTLALIPETLEMMACDMEWTDRLSQAFVTQQDSLCESIQSLRRRARANGALRDSDYIRVVDSGNYIIINSAYAGCAAVPVYNASVYSCSPTQTFLNTVLSWTTVRILDSLFYGGTWDWHHHRVYMNRAPHRYQVPYSVVPPYKPQFHQPVRHVAVRPDPPQPAPPPKPHHAKPVPHPPKPHHAEPVPSPKPHHAEPVPPPKPHHTKPVPPAPKPHHAEPVAPAPKPHHAKPVLPEPKPHKSAPESAKPHGLKPAPDAHPHGYQPVPARSRSLAHKPAAEPAKVHSVKPAAASKPQNARPVSGRPAMQERPHRTPNAASDKGAKPASHRGSKPGDKKTKR